MIPSRVFTPLYGMHMYPPKRGISTLAEWDLDWVVITNTNYLIIYPANGLSETPCLQATDFEVLIPCGHPAITDTLYYGKNPNPQVEAKEA